MSILNNRKNSYNVFDDNGVLSVKTFKLNSAYHINVAYINKLLKDIYNITSYYFDEGSGITLNLGDVIGNDSKHSVTFVPYDFVKKIYSTQMYRDLHLTIVSSLEQYVVSEAKQIDPSDVSTGKVYPTNLKERENVSVYKTSQIQTDNGTHIQSVLTDNGKKFIHVNYIAYLFVTTPGIVKLLVTDYIENELVGNYIMNEHTRTFKGEIYYTKYLFLNALRENDSFNSAIAITAGVKRINSI